MSDTRLPIGSDVALEALLRETLAQARQPAPFPIDVEQVVMARIEELGAVPAAGVGMRQLAAWAAAAAAAGAVIVSGIATHSPTITQIAGGVGRTTGESASLAVRVGLTASSILAALGRIAIAIGHATSAIVAPLAQLRPVTTAVVTVSVAGMLAFTTFIVARDFRAGAAPKE